MKVEDFVDKASLLVNIAIAPEDRDQTIENFQRIAAIADVLMKFELPSEEIGSAAVFTP